MWWLKQPGLCTRNFSGRHCLFCDHSMHQRILLVRARAAGQLSFLQVEDVNDPVPLERYQESDPLPSPTRSMPVEIGSRRCHGARAAPS
mmetsp:Transcript_3046/g.8760  ORF Transcript_3046/g.8760 Transcript_3046/m.8760 type:complete len:89 (+) Transcript_3046:287-553(+)